MGVIQGDVRVVGELPAEPGISIPVSDGEIQFGATKFDYDGLIEDLTEGRAAIAYSRDPNGKLTGFVAWTTKQHSHPNLLQMIWVDDQKKGTGQADELLEFALMKMPPGDVHLSLFGMERAGRFFERHGFKSNPGDGFVNRLTLPAMQRRETMV